MSRLRYRGSITLAAVVVALLASRPAAAQVVVPAPARQHDGLANGLITGSWYDRANQADAEWHLQHRQQMLNRDVQQGNSRSPP